MIGSIVTICTVGLKHVQYIKHSHKGRKKNKNFIQNIKEDIFLHDEDHQTHRMRVEKMRVEESL